MGNPSPDQVQRLSADLVPFFGDRKVSMLVLKVASRSMETQSNSEGLELEIGTVNLEVLEVIHGDTLRPGDVIEVWFKRFAYPPIRVRNSFDSWNAIDLSPGAVWLMAGQVVDKSNLVTGLAAFKINSVSSPEVNAARQCYAIENTKDQPDKRRALINEALKSNTPLLRFYALDLLQRRGAYSRVQSTNMIADAIASDVTDVDAKVDLGFSLTHFFIGELKGDEANERIVAVLAQALVSERDLERRLQWVDYLASTILSELSPVESEERALRSALIGKVQRPAPEQVITALNLQGDLVDATGAERIRDLQNAWRNAV